MRSLRVSSAPDAAQGDHSTQADFDRPSLIPFAAPRKEAAQSTSPRKRADKIDVILLHSSRPRSDRIESAVRLHASAPGVPVMVVVDAGDTDFPLLLLQARAEDFLLRRQMGNVEVTGVIRRAFDTHRSRIVLEQGLRALERRESGFANAITTRSDAATISTREGTVLFHAPALVSSGPQPLETIYGELLGHPFALRSRHEVDIGGEIRFEVHVVQNERGESPTSLVSLVEIAQGGRAPVTAPVRARSKAKGRRALAPACAT